MVLSVWSCFGSNHRGFFSGTVFILILMLFVHAGGIQASLSLGPEGNLPRFRDVFLHALSHDDTPSLLVNLCCFLLMGPCQEQRWGTVAFLGLSAVSMVALPCAYSLVLWVGVGEASRICGYSAVQLALFTAQCRQMRGRRLLKCVPLWLLPWLALLLALLLLPGTPALLHFCAICIGHNYSPSFIETVQELERFSGMGYIPPGAYISNFSRPTLPTHCTPHSSHSESHHREDSGFSMSPHPPGTSFGYTARCPDTGSRWGVDPSHSAAGFRWDGFVGASEAELLEDQLFHAGILASLQDAPDRSLGVCAQDDPDNSAHIQEILPPPEAKVELPKSCVSSLRLQQLERMGFPTEKAVVALAASKQLEGAVSLLIDDSIGSEAIVVGPKSPGPPPQMNTGYFRNQQTIATGSFS